MKGDHMPRGTPPKIQGRVVALYEQGYCLKEVEGLTGVKWRTVYRILCKHKVETRSVGARKEKVREKANQRRDRIAAMHGAAVSAVEELETVRLLYAWVNLPAPDQVSRAISLAKEVAAMQRRLIACANESNQSDKG